MGPVALLLGCAGLLVGSDVVERRCYPEMATGWRHFFLTIRSALITGIGCGVVYGVMRHHHRRLAEVADQLSSRLREHGWAAMSAEAPAAAPAGRAQVPAPTARDEHPGSNGSIPRSNGQSPAVRSPERGGLVGFLREDGLSRLGASFDELLVMLDAEGSRVRRLHDQMLDKEKMAALGQMAAGIAHEIANPLSSISSIVQMIRRKAAPNFDVKELDLLQKHTERITQTVRQLGCLSRPEAQRWELADPGAALEEAVSLVSFDHRARGIQLDFRRPQPLPRTWMIPGRMQQVFINLLLNGFDAMPDGGKLTVSATRQRDSLRFGFADTGCGIPASIGRRVFEPFFTTKAAGRGTGLGLAVSFGIVQQHKGKIEFAPREGGGTVFTVDIPILTRSPEPTP